MYFAGLHADQDDVGECAPEPRDRKGKGVWDSGWEAQARLEGDFKAKGSADRGVCGLPAGTVREGEVHFLPREWAFYGTSPVSVESGGQGEDSGRD